MYRAMAEETVNTVETQINRGELLRAELGIFVCSELKTSLIAYS